MERKYLSALTAEDADMNKFNFFVEHVKYNDYEEWSVSLPHQCGGWEITHDDSDIFMPDPAKTKTEAVAALKQFILEANEALVKLEAIDE